MDYIDTIALSNLKMAEHYEVKVLQICVNGVLETQILLNFALQPAIPELQTI